MFTSLCTEVFWGKVGFIRALTRAALLSLRTTAGHRARGHITTRRDTDNFPPCMLNSGKFPRFEGLGVFVVATVPCGHLLQTYGSSWKGRADLDEGRSSEGTTTRFCTPLT